jgi:hypothetical protein
VDYIAKSYIVNLDLYATKPVQTKIFYTAGEQNACPLPLTP